jgi:uncharacterized protein (TIGR00255 family)
MIQSMTGYGKAESEFQNKKITVEIKSLNSKQFDTIVRIPNAYKGKEVEIRNQLSQTIERGKVDFTLLVDLPNQSLSGRLNRSVVENYYEEIKETALNLGIDAPSDWLSVILHLPDTIKTEAAAEPEEGEWEHVCQTIGKALKSLVEFRTSEGTMLEKVFTKNIHAISQLLKEIDPYEIERVEKIKARIQDLFLKSEIQYDENRLEQEMIYYIERLDINEEKARLSNHLDYFLETMANEKSQGKKLGFIVQEIGREINTLGSKSNHAAMQKIVVQMKDELEQVKEQILNVL